MGVGETFYRAIRLRDLKEGGAVRCEVRGTGIAVVSQEGRISAFLDVCPHAGSPLSGGRVRRGRIFCPLHGAPFDLENGKCLAPQKYDSLTMYNIRLEEEWVEVAIPDAPTSAADE